MNVDLTFWLFSSTIISGTNPINTIGAKGNGGQAIPITKPDRILKINGRPVLPFTEIFSIPCYVLPKNSINFND